MSFSPSNLARTPSASQLSGRRRSFLNRARRPPLAGHSPVARSTPWLSTCTLTWSLRNPGSEISTTSWSSPGSFHSTTGSKSSYSRAAPRRRSMAGRRPPSGDRRRRTLRRPRCSLSPRAYTDSDPSSRVYIFSGRRGSMACRRPELLLYLRGIPWMDAWCGPGTGKGEEGRKGIA